MINEVRNFLNQPDNAYYKNALEVSFVPAALVGFFVTFFNNMLVCDEGLKINGTQVTTTPLSTLITCSVLNSPNSVPMGIGTGLAMFIPLALVGCIGAKAMKMIDEMLEVAPNMPMPQNVSAIKGKFSFSKTF